MSTIKLKVIPGAKTNEIVGTWQDMLKVKVTAPPEDGKANKACIELLSKKYGVQKNKIRVVKGIKSREKVLEILD